MNHLDIETIYQQIAHGIRELINGEGGSGRILNMEADTGSNAIVVELAEMSKNFQNTLIEEVKENLTEWRINPFDNIVYEGNQKLVFYLKDEDEILKTYRNLL
jgi:UDP-N-acetylglucosamine transferase subunit ALG13